MQFVITGASGFLGKVLCAAALRAWPGATDRFFFIDRQFTQATGDSRAVQIEQDLSELGPLEPILQEADVIFHLAAIPGGQAECDYELSKRINLNASLALFELLRNRRASAPRLVYASSIAVFGEPLPAEIHDQTVPRPTMTYGAHKLMVETELVNLTRVGRINAWALRLPGLVARPDVTSGLKSAFLSDLFHACAQGRPFAVPMSPEASVWLMSASCGADNLIHAASVEDAPPHIPRAITLPTLRVTVRELVTAVSLQCAYSVGKITYQPDPTIEAQFGRLPPLVTGFGDQLGFRHDGDLDLLVKNAFLDAGYSPSMRLRGRVSM